LTVNFARSVNTTTQIPVTMQVVLTPLAPATSVLAGGTFVEAPVAREVVLSATVNSVVFRLVPTDLPGLSQRVLYRIAWRPGGVTGRTFTYDFAMPDADVSFEQLNSLGYVIGGEAYLQHADLGRAGGVARLNDDGKVVDAAGTPSANSSDITVLSQALQVERVTRQNADEQTRLDLEASLGVQANQIVNTTNSTVSNVRAELSTLITNEIAARQATDASLAFKADLVSGKIPLTQIPDAARTQGVQVTDQAAMLALTTAQVQQFDFAIRPDGVFALLGTDPSQLGHWSKLNKVTSVNGLDGEVVLNLSQVAANGGAIAQSQVTDLAGTLAGKASTIALATTNGRITAIETDTTVVKTVGGVIPNALNDSRMAYLDVTGQFITRKDGTIISGAGGAVSSVNGKAGVVSLSLTDVATVGGTVPQAQVTDLSTTLSGKVDTTDTRLTNSRTPTAHATSHAAGGSDALTLTTAQVTGLATTLTGYGNRIGDLETRVTGIETSGTGSGGSGTVGVLSWFSGTATTGNLNSLVLHSPFGYNPANASANAQGFYYNPAGAPSSEVRYPYLTPNGHLKLVKWDETAATDPVYATQTALDAVSLTVAGKADTTALAGLGITAATGTQSAQYYRGDKTWQVLNQDVVPSGTANKVFTAAEQTKLAGIAAGATVNSTNATLLDRANHTGTQVAATISNFSTAADARITAALGTTVQAQIATGTTTQYFRGDKTFQTLNAAAVTGAEATANKNQNNGYAGLDAAGKLLTSVLPSSALTTVTEVTTRNGMTALTAAQVQPGDICIITATDDQGSYILSTADPTVFANWKKLGGNAGGITSVNGVTSGAVTITAAGLGALTAGTSATVGAQIGSIFNLSTTLDGKINSTTLASTILNRPTWAATAGANATTAPTLEKILTDSTPVKQVATYVATINITSLNGQQPADGIALMPIGSTVLLTAQGSYSSSVLNGLWQVNSGAWTRTTDMAASTYFVKGTVVAVSSGTHANTFWQLTSTSGIVDTNTMSWAKITTAYVPSGGDGITITSNTSFAVKAKLPTQVGTNTLADPNRMLSSGILVDTTGVSVDTTVVARKYVGDVPVGSPIPTISRIYHNLGTRRVLVQVIETSGTNAAVLVGWTATNLNYIDLEFAVAPITGQWAVIVIG
jgi:hypothetical protein